MVENITRTENTTIDFDRYWMIDNINTDNDKLTIDDGEELIAVRVSPEIKIKLKGDIKLNADLDLSLPTGTSIDIEYSINDGSNWISILEEEAEISADGNINILIKQILETGIALYDDNMTVSDSHTNSDDDTYSDDDNIADFLDSLLGITHTEDTSETPELDGVITEIELIDGQMTRRGTLLFKGRSFSQDIDNGDI